LLNSSELIPLLSIKPGDLLNTIQLKTDMEHVIKQYAAKGGSLGGYDLSIDSGSNLVIRLIERKISKIIVSGNSRTKTNVIMRELESKEGQLLDIGKVTREREFIYNLGFFEDVTPQFEEDKNPDSVTYTIKVTEKKTGTADSGLGYSAKDGFLGYLDVSENNFLGYGQRLNLRLELGSKGTRIYEMGYNEPWLLNNRTSFGVNLYSREAPLEEDGIFYTETISGGNTIIGRPIGLDSNISIKLKLENAVSRFKETNELAVLPGDGATHSITLAYDKDTRDNFVIPTDGLQTSLSVESAGGILGGRNEFV
jgi:outer membrane protein insertion porin family